MSRSDSHGSCLKAGAWATRNRLSKEVSTRGPQSHTSSGQLPTSRPPVKSGFSALSSPNYTQFLLAFSTWELHIRFVTARPGLPPDWTAA